jgi:hypothetical protein
LAHNNTNNMARLRPRGHPSRTSQEPQQNVLVPQQLVSRSQRKPGWTPDWSKRSCVSLVSIGPTLLAAYTMPKVRSTSNTVLVFIQMILMLWYLVSTRYIDSFSMSFWVQKRRGGSRETRANGTRFVCSDYVAVMEKYQGWIDSADGSSPP